MPAIYGPSPTSSVAQAQRAAEKLVDQIESAASSKNLKSLDEAEATQRAEATQWAEMTALANILLDLEGDD